MDIVLEQVPINDKPVLAALMQFYMHDSSEYTGDDVNEHGTYGYYFLDHYWTEAGRYPYLIRVDRRIAGLALVRTLAGGEDPLYQLAEFFILRKYRRQGIGRTAATMLFDRFPGRWEVGQESGNHAGQAFWRQIISDYTAGHYEEAWRESEHHRGPVQLFDSRQARHTDLGDTP